MYGILTSTMSTKIIYKVIKVILGIYVYIYVCLICIYTYI
nr:MAG TPA_asm: hypothetical protein [Caudoviricetes sp.]